MTNDLPEKLQAARFLCSSNWPYLASALWAIHPIESKGLGTYAVDKWWRLYYDPDLTWDVQGMATVLYHEINHLLRSHCPRSENMAELDPKAWNICADAEINDDIDAEGQTRTGIISWPIKDYILPKRIKMPDNLLAEEYYSKLPVMKINVMDCGSGAHGQKRPHEQDGPADKGEGQSKTPGLTPGEGELLRRHVANEIASSTSRGSIPEHWKRWAELTLDPKVDWRKVLKAQIKHSLTDITGKSDYTFKKPSRRNIPHIILPSMQSPVPRVAVVVDTSGSIGQEALNSAISEIHGILKACGQARGVNVIACDAAVHTAKNVFSASQVELGGGGGTDMRVGIEHAIKGNRYDRPHLVVVLTDGYTPWPDSEPHAKIIIVLLNTASEAKGCPTWAKVIKVD